MNKEELIRKIKALAERGEGGEKENAQKLLAELMVKYNIKEEDIADEVIKDFDFKIPKVFKAKELVSQVIYSVVGKEAEDNKGLYICGAKRNKFIIKCTAAEFLEIEAKFKFYLHYLKIESDRFYNAFVQANNIFPPPDKKIEEKQKFFLSDEDLKMLELAGRLETHEYRLQIEGKSYE